MSISRLGTAVALSLLLASPLAGQGTKVGYINSVAVLAEYGPAQDARGSLQATFAGFQAEVDNLDSAYQQALAEYQQQMTTMTPEARQERERQLQTQLDARHARSQELQDLFEQRETEVFGPINEAIRSVLEEIRVEGNYGMILDVAVQAILVADPALDLTQQVLIRLQARSGSEDGS
ncbi:MAG: OmpH family outer membrane protein [Gemmatimonadota bacterium]|nr:OmpH family outer membrane protein [Gemmatimonadota bacterium]